MQFEFLTKEDVIADWSVISKIMQPSFEVAGSNANDVLATIQKGIMDVIKITDGDSFLYVIMVGGKKCYLNYVAGSIGKGIIRLVKKGIKRIEQAAKDGGAKEIRIYGRDWSRILSDYKPTGGNNNEMRKVL